MAHKRTGTIAPATVPDLIFAAVAVRRTYGGFCVLLRHFAKHFFHFFHHAI